MQNIEQVRVKILHFNGLTYHRALAVVDVGNLIGMDEGRTLCHAGDAPIIIWLAMIYRRFDALCRRLRACNVQFVRTPIKALSDLTSTI